MRSLVRKLRSLVLPGSTRNFSSEDYWVRRYEHGRDSGRGSYGRLAEFKANVLNRLVEAQNIVSVIEFGSGDGNQLTLSNYPKYVGYDVSSTAVAACSELFKDDASKEFFLVSDYDGRKADMAMSLDVVYHLIENAVFEDYMRRLFGAAERFVVIYSSNQCAPIEPVAEHVRHRHFTKWIEQNISPQWELSEKIPNAFPYVEGDDDTSVADFYIYAKAGR